MYLSVVIPAYNEEKRIGATLQSVCAWLAKREYAWEVIVVDNRSTDATADVVRGFQHQYPAVRLIRETHPGKGSAVTTGILEATGDVRLFTDADNSTSIEHFTKMKYFLDEGYDVAIGSLGVPGARVLHGGGEPWWRVLLGKLGNLWIQLWAVPGIWDTQRGFKVFTAKAAKDIFSRMTIFGWGFDVEVLAIARAHGYRIKEVPIVWNNDPDSKVNIWAYPKVLMQTLKVFWNRVTGKYKRKKE